LLEDENKLPSLFIAPFLSALISEGSIFKLAPGAPALISIFFLFAAV
jgi:hypothetical protein